MPPIDIETERSNKINSLKLKDPIFAKRFEQFEIFKAIKKAPIFDYEKTPSEMNVPKTFKERDKKELLNIIDYYRKLRVNPYTAIQNDLQYEVSKFCKQDMNF